MKDAKRATQKNTFQLVSVHG